MAVLPQNYYGVCARFCVTLDSPKRNVKWENKTPSTPPLAASTKSVQLLKWRHLTSYRALGQAAVPLLLVGIRERGGRLPDGPGGK